MDFRSSIGWYGSVFRPATFDERAGFFRKDARRMALEADLQGIASAGQAYGSPILTDLQSRFRPAKRDSCGNDWRIFPYHVQRPGFWLCRQRTDRCALRGTRQSASVETGVNEGVSS
jgi:hypothetical protein